MLFRCDDVSLNTDILKLSNMIGIINKKFPQCNIILGISPLVHEIKEENLLKERIFPKIFNAFSDFRVFYKTDKCGIPNLECFSIYNNITLASHGLIHVDHRLLKKEVQELSIITSSSLVKSSIFIPPFNKWNKDTEEICKENEIELIKFEDNWKHILYNKISEDGKYYFHTHDFTLDFFNEKINGL